MTWMLGGVWAAALVGSPAARAEMLTGFETGDDLGRWSTGGQIRVDRVASPAPPEEAAQDGPQGNAARIVTPGQSGFFIKAGELPPDLTVFDTLRFWVHRDPAENAAVPSTIEVRFYEQDGGAWFWRKIVLDQAGWTQVEVPLKWVRWSATRVPRWDKVDRLGIFFRDAAEVLVDSISLTDDPPQNGPEDKPVPKPKDIARLAFGDAAADTGKVRIDRADDVAVITDAPDCEVDKLLEHLGTVAAAVKADMPFAGSPTNLVMMVVFAEEDRYQKFPVKLSERLGAQSAPITSSGYTVQGIATSSWHPRHGTLRPVFSHEFVHALLSATLQLENKGEWFQEGLATHYQLRFHPQANIRSVVSDSLKEADAETLKKVCSGARIPLERYWVVGTLCRMLLEDPTLAAKLPAVVAAMQKSGSTALEPLLPQLGLSWEELDERWRTFCRQNYGD